MRLPIKQDFGRKNHTGRAVAALYGSGVNEGLLDRVQVADASQPLDGGNALSVH